MMVSLCCFDLSDVHVGLQDVVRALAPDDVLQGLQLQGPERDILNNKNENNVSNSYTYQ